MKTSGGGHSELNHRFKACKKENKCCNNDVLYHYYKRHGFTLAEVLNNPRCDRSCSSITLTTVIPEIQNKQNIAKWKKEYSVINTAFNEVLGGWGDYMQLHSRW